MKKKKINRLVALACAFGCIAGLCGCNKVMQYVDTYVPPTTPEFIQTGPMDTTYVPGETTPEATKPAEQPTLVGVVSGARVLNVRSGPGTEYEKVGELDEGTKIAIYEVQEVGDSLWGRTKMGWLSMNYIELEEQDDGKTVTPVPTTAIIATVTTNDLNVRSGPGTRYERVDRLNTGDKVQITEICVLDKILWGLASMGWLCMSYVSIEGTPDGSLQLGCTINATELMIRSSAGEDGKALGRYNNGDKIVITELRAVDYVPWGKTDKGWVCMKYVIPDGNIIVSAG